MPSPRRTRAAGGRPFETQFGTLYSPNITPADLQPVREAGWNDEQIYYAITVCALFNFYNRWIDASGVHALSDDAHREGGKRSVATGYVRK